MEEVFNLNILKVAKRVLQTLFILIISTMATDQVFLVFKFHSPVHEMIKSTSPREELLRTTPHEPVGSYLEAISEKNLFGISYQSETRSVRKASIDELAKDLRLKGIAVFDSSEAIFENASTRQTLFLKVGDKIGELKVEKILKETVILSSQSEKKELRVEGSA